MKNKGSVLLGSLMMVTVISMVLIGIDTNNQGGSGFMQVVTSEHSWVQRDYANAAAVNLAEAGLEKALDEIAKNWSNGSGYSHTESFSIGSYSVQTIVSTASTYTLKSTGTVSQYGSGTITRKIQLTVNKGTGGGGNYAALSGGNFELGRSSTAMYNTPAIAIHTNGNLEMEGSLAVYAAAGGYAGITASGNIETEGSVAASEVTPNAESVSLPTANFSELQSEASEVINGNLEIEGGSIGSSGAVTYIKGNLEAEGNITGRGTIVVEGNVELEGTIKPPTGETLEIITKGNFEFEDVSSGIDIEANVYCEGNLELSSGSPWLKGAATAKGNWEFGGGSLRIDYQAATNSKLISGSGTPTVSDWKEVY